MRSGSRLVVGCMTGTSLDGLDVAIVAIDGRGCDMAARFVRGVSVALGEVRAVLTRLADQQPLTALEIASAARAFSLLHASAIRELLAGERADLICVHGQTVCHAPPVSWQMFNPAVLAHEVGAPVVCDLRAADLAAGGQGAPITPLADLVLFGDASSRCVINLGGFCNVTLLPAVRPDQGRAALRGAIRGFDVCACNHVLNSVARATLAREFDENGAAAMSGRVDTRALDDLHAVLSGQAAGGRSLGTGDEAGAWVTRHRSRVSAADLCATACQAIALCVAARVRPAGTLAADLPGSIVLAGGGARNLALRGAIARTCGREVIDTSALGVPIEMREAACMAVLGALCADRVPITLGGITGASEEMVAGVWAYPAREIWRAEG